MTNCTSYNNGLDSISGSKYSNFKMYRASEGRNKGLLSLAVSANEYLGDDSFNGTLSNSVVVKSNKMYSVTQQTIGSAGADGTSINTGAEGTSELTASAGDFVSIKMPEADYDVHRTMRNADGGIDLKGFLTIKSSSALRNLGVGASLTSFTGNEAGDAADESDALEPAQKNKIDMYDFGVEQFDSEIYNNRLSVDVINGWYNPDDPNIKVGQADSTNNYVNRDVIVSEGSAELFKIHSASTKKIRVYTDNTNVTRQQTKTLKSIDEKTIYHGAIACNGTQNIDSFYFEFDLTCR